MKRIEACVEQLIKEGFSEIDRRYGPKGETPKSHHNLEHTSEVLEDATAIAKLALARGKISEADLTEIQLAAAYHDYDSDLPYGEAEKSSALVVMDKMKREKVFNKDTIKRVGGLVVSTTVKWVGGKMKQLAGPDYPSKIMADADLANVGKPFEIFMDRSVKIMREQKEDPAYQPDNDFYVAEIAFLENHKFYTEEAAELFPHKEENLERLRELIHPE
jgi:predicted metal-dependent HD superfamily phosphohydrolase